MQYDFQFNSLMLKKNLTLHKKSLFKFNKYDGYLKTMIDNIAIKIKSKLRIAIIAPDQFFTE